MMMGSERVPAGISCQYHSKMLLMFDHSHGASKLFFFFFFATVTIPFFFSFLEDCPGTQD